MSGRDPSMEWTGQIENERPYLLRFARMRLRDPDAAEDAVQDTLLVALAGRTPFLGRSSLRTWLTSILNHKIMDVYRKNASDRARGYSYGGDSDATGIQKMEHDVLDNIDAGQHQPDAELERKQLARQLMAAIHSLPARQRDVFMLYQMSGCSGDEIAKTVGLSNSNVWVMLHRARKVLRAELQEVYQ
ncbi:MAG TPA: sigma-70 family RNA polymerase sigma factor [Usitatibacteraceae bacterium]